MWNISILKIFLYLISWILSENWLGNAIFLSNNKILKYFVKKHEIRLFVDSFFTTQKPWIFYKIYFLFLLAGKCLETFHSFFSIAKTLLSCIVLKQILQDGMFVQIFQILSLELWNFELKKRDLTAGARAVGVAGRGRPSKLAIWGRIGFIRFIIGWIPITGIWIGLFYYGHYFWHLILLEKAVVGVCG